MTTRLLGAILVILLAGPVNVARAQGTQGVLADPITTPQLMDFADRLGLSSAQRAAIEPLHDSYKEEFRQLRDGEIAEFMAETSRMGGMMPKREQLEEMISNMEKLQAKIKVIDDRLFERLLPILTEDQIVRLPRIRLLRERQRHLATARQGAAMTGQNIVDLSEIVRDLQLSADVLEIADPTLGAYERRFTTDLAKLNESMFRMYLDMIDGIAAAGFEDVDFMDPETDPDELKRFQETMAEIWMNLQSGIRERGRAIAKDERRTVTSVVALLPPRDASRFRTAYYSEAYPEVRFALPVDEIAWIVRAIDDERVPAATRDTMRPIVTEFLDQLHRLAGKAVEAVEAQREETNVFDFGSRDTGDLDSLRTSAQEARSTVNSTLVDVLGAEELARVQTMIGAAASVGPDESVETGEVVQEDIPIDVFMAPRLTRSEIRGMALYLSLNEGEQAVLESLYTDYVTAYKELGALREFSEVQQRQWVFDPETQTARPAGGDVIDELYRLRRKSIDEIRAADDAFFGEVRALVDEPRQPLVERLRTRRERSVYQRDRGNMWGGPNVATAMIDLSDLLTELDPSADERARVDPILSEYEAESLGALRARLETMLVLTREDERWMAEVQRAQADGENIDWREYQKVIAAGSSRTREADAVILEMNRQTLDAISAELSAETRHRLKRAFERRSYPAVYEDPQSVEEHLTRALALEELGSAQLADLRELAASYRPAYESLSRRLVEYTTTMPDFGNWDAEQMQKYQETQSEVAKLTYDRNELSHRAARRIRAVLDDSQLAMIGGLPAPSDG